MTKHVRVVTPLVIEGPRRVDQFRHLERDDLRISTVSLDKGPTSVESQFESSLVVPDTCAKIMQAEKEGVDAVVVDCLGDIAVYEGRECVSIPVLGPFETCVHLASVLAYKYGVVTMVEEVVAIMESYAKKYGAADKLVSIRAIRMPVLEMEANPEERDQRLVETSIRLVKHDGAAAIVLGCSGMLGAAEKIRNRLLAEGMDVPVIDPVPTTILIAATLVDAKISHSKKSFPTPHQKSLSAMNFSN